MDVLALGLQVVTWAGMVAASAWGWKRIDSETRIRARVSATGPDYTMSKMTALILTPFMGLLVVLGTLAVRDGDNENPIAWVGLAILVMFLLAHWSSVKRAAR